MLEQHSNKRRFSPVYFGLIYVYTLLFSLLEKIPFVSPILLQHLPHPQQLVSDTYQPISDRAASSTPELSPTFHEDDYSVVSSGDSASESTPRQRRRRRGSLEKPILATPESNENSRLSSFNSNNRWSPFANKPETARGSFTASPANSIASTTASIFNSSNNKSDGSGGLKRKTLVLDLDETLIHSSPQGSYRAHHRIEVVIDKVACLYYVYKRPHVDYFLRRVSEWYKVVVFTASLAEYADPVIDLLDSQGRLIEGRYFRESCIPHDSSYAKDLSAIESDLSQIVLVDNSPLSYFINPTNGIPIQPWVNGDPKDEALLDLLPLLDALRFTDDVRSILSLRLV